MISRPTQNVAPRASFCPVFWHFANYIPILTEAMSHSTFLYLVECRSLVKL